jgi:FkbH-like protein
VVDETGSSSPDAWSTPFRVFDPHSDHAGQIPYTLQYFTHLGTRLVRSIDAVRRPTCKVIALDCDNTLWDGVCGEDGPTGVRIGRHRRRLQNLLLNQMKKGRLLVLTSKNVPEDVWAVFDQHPDMILQREHIAAAEISWGPKSEALQRLAQRLNLGLDSFLFLDDNEVECAAVRSQRPEVCTVRVPRRADALGQTLRSVWLLDGGRQSDMDGKRTAFYRANVERSAVRDGAPSLADFIESLNLDITIRQAGLEDVPRCVQLTQRTNQFHANPARRSEAEVSRLLGDPKAHVWVVDVTDRFGAYGIVGLMVATEHDDSGRRVWRVESFLMSCRSLGRGVEHAMVAALGKAASRNGVDVVDIPVRRTPKNEPVRRFLQHPSFGQPRDASLSRQNASGDGAPAAHPLPRDDDWAVDTVHVLTAMPSALERVKPDWSTTPTITSKRRHREELGPPHIAASATSAHAHHMRLLEQIPEELASTKSVHEAIAQTQLRPRPSEGGPYVPPKTSTEEALCSLYEEVLQVRDVGRTDDFFWLGGNSLLGAVLLGRACNALEVELSLPEIFHHTTPAALARRVSAAWIASLPDEEVARHLNELDDLTDDEIRGLAEGT